MSSLNFIKAIQSKQGLNIQEKLDLAIKNKYILNKTDLIDLDNLLQSLHDELWEIEKNRSTNV